MSDVELSGSNTTVADTSGEKCTIITELFGIDLGECGADVTHTSNGHCPSGHIRSRRICTNHAVEFIGHPEAVMCRKCADKGNDVQMILHIFADEE